MQFTESAIIELYENSRTKAVKKLSSLGVAEGRKPAVWGLNGWIFEQTIRFCLSRELLAVGLCPQMQDQVSLKGRAKIDLLVGRAAVELKAGGAFGAGDDKYLSYKKVVVERGWIYFYLSLTESHDPYRRSTVAMFGERFTFFLDTKNNWKLFVKAIIANHK